MLGNILFHLVRNTHVKVGYHAMHKIGYKLRGTHLVNLWRWPFWFDKVVIFNRVAIQTAIQQLDRQVELDFQSV